MKERSDCVVEEYSQRAEISKSEFGMFCEVLMRNGYEVKCQLDTESNMVIVEYLHTGFTGHSFQETEI